MILFMICLFALSRHRKYSACSLKLFLVVNVVIVVHNNCTFAKLCVFCTYFNHRWSRRLNARGQELKKNPRPRTNFFQWQTLSRPRTGKVEAKAKDRGHNFS